MSQFFVASLPFCLGTCHIQPVICYLSTLKSGRVALVSWAGGRSWQGMDRGGSRWRLLAVAMAMVPLQWQWQMCPCSTAPMEPLPSPCCHRSGHHRLCDGQVLPALGMYHELASGTPEANGGGDSTVVGPAPWVCSLWWRWEGNDLLHDDAAKLVRLFFNVEPPDCCPFEGLSLQPSCL
jgi:hypothetical protein